MKLFGLRINRIPRFLRCISSMEGRFAGYSSLIKGAGYVLTKRSQLPLPQTARNRYRTCLKCPYYQPKMERCAMCHCYVPYKVSGTPFGAPCPLRELHPSNPNKGWI